MSALTEAFESAFGRVLCLPGCMTMFRTSTLASDDFFFQVLKKFALRPDQSSLISHICKEKGEDRWLTLLIIEMSSKLAPKGLSASEHLSSERQLGFQRL